MWSEWQENLIAIGGGILFAIAYTFMQAYGYGFNLLSGYLTYQGVDYSVWVAPSLGIVLIIVSFVYGRSAKAKLAGTIGLVLFVVSLPLLAAPYLPT